MQDGIPVDDLAGAAVLAFRWLHAAHGDRLEVTHPQRDRRPRSTPGLLSCLRGDPREPEEGAARPFS